ncbi:hypothetical protein [Rheinheimera pacifica]|uniref:hypothetical protein n=1 Tax=Rheinheimera pacifica TaxID=173990 RepID=UPI002EDB2A4A
MMNVRAAPIACKEKISGTQLLEMFLGCCKTAKQRQLVRTVWEHQGVLTHHLTELYGFRSNNHHNFSQSINPRLLVKGWVIAKHKPSEPHGSWRWFIQPAYQALSCDIKPTLRQMILDHLKAANDE